MAPLHDKDVQAARLLEAAIERAENKPCCLSAALWTAVLCYPDLRILGIFRAFFEANRPRSFYFVASW
jgi:hypothetical protein